MTITPRMEAVLELLTECAEEGKPCPRNHEIGAAIGSNKQNVSMMISKLELRGMISVEREIWDRVVTITATRKSTARVSQPEFEIKQDRHFAVNAAKAAVAENTLIVRRDPCWRCGVLGDIGCEHQPRSMPITLSEAGRVNV